MTIRIVFEKQLLDAKLTKLLERVRDPQVLTTRWAGHMREAVMKNFEMEGRPAWRGLKESTLEARAKKGKTGKILQVSGKLMSSIHSRHNRKEAVIGTNREYAGTHQYGNLKLEIPARPFLKLTPEDERIMVLAAEKFLSGA